MKNNFEKDNARDAPFGARRWATGETKNKAIGFRWTRLDFITDIRYNGNIRKVRFMALKRLLEDRGISMYRLSKMSGVPNTVVVDLCSGKSAIENCTVKTVCAIAKALGCSVDELLGFYYGRV